MLADSEFAEVPGGVVQQTCRTCIVEGPRSRSSTGNAAAVRAYRERTGDAYGKAYRKARDLALKELIALHPEEYALLMDSARRSVGLGPTRA